MSTMNIDIGGQKGTVILGVEKGSGLTVMHGPHNSLALLVGQSSGEAATIVLDENGKNALLAYANLDTTEGTA